MPFGGADLHFHSNVSDGVEAPADLVQRALEAGLSVAALTDHDAVRGIREFEEAAEGTGLVAAGGTELSVDEEGEDVHLLGLFVDPEEPALLERLAAFREARERRAEAIVGRLRELGIALDVASVRAAAGEGALGRPHVARALVAAGVVESEGEAFRKYLVEGAPAFVPKARWGLGEAIEAVWRAGGLAVVAHPVWYRDVAGLLAKARGLGLDGVEVFHPDNDGREDELLALAKRLDLLVTAGSDFHAPSASGGSLGARRLDEPLWERVADAARARRRLAGRPGPDLVPR